MTDNPVEEFRPNHSLKTRPEFFQAAWIGDKTFEVRKNDRDFRERDEVTLVEFQPETNDYSGREIHGVIRYLTHFEQKEGFVVFSIEQTGRTE
jgi:hypothetical protein